MGGGRAGCELCEAARLTTWYSEDDVCWVADCEICAVPMVVWRQHGVSPPPEARAHMEAALGKAADAVLGPGTWSLDDVMRQIPDHFHAHARDPGWWVLRAERTAARARASSHGGPGGPDAGDGAGGA
ncbi:MAG TPA: hypothetical protein VLZ77_13855 [Acidimicrobiales bacterium]|nr:hypothetical protein [Acidimicrobiales bacterium]